jgi:hypothetical protein
MSETETVDFPLLHDHHSHVSLYAAMEGLPDLDPLPAGAEGRATALALLRGLPRDRLNIVKGWHSDRLELGTGELASLPPALIVNSSLHGFALTPAGLPHAAALWPELAERADDAGWGERNLGEIFAFYGRVAGLTLAKLEAFMARMEGLGLGSLEDMTVAGEEAISLFASSSFSERIIPWASPSLFRDLGPGSRRRCAGIKIFLDGSLGARSAALGSAFLGGEEGSLVHSDEELDVLLREIAGYGTGLSAHAIGRLAVEQAISGIERLRREGISFPLARIEHAQFIDLEQARRCKAASIVLSMQPNFNSDSADYADRLGPGLLEANDPFRMLVDEAGFLPGKDLVFGSDGMPHGPEHALRWSLFPAYPAQALSAGELSRGYGEARGLTAGSPGAVFSVDRRSRGLSRLK